MPVTVGTYGATDASGWSTFTSPPFKCYVSSSSGADSTPNPQNPSTPFRTIAAAYNWIGNNGFLNGIGGWLLLKKDDIFHNQRLSANSDGTFDGGGTSIGPNPLVFGAYDPANPTVVNPPTGGARPIIEMPPGGAPCIGFSSRGGYGNWTAFVGLDFYSWTCDPDNPGYLTYLNSGNGISSQKRFRLDVGRRLSLSLLRQRLGRDA